jgi:hypothetical protein
LYIVAYIFKGIYQYLPHLNFDNNNSNTMGKRDSGKDKSPVKPIKGKGRANSKPDGLNEMLQNVAEEIAE